ncbi:NAD(P)-dependent oxidoreductase [Clostridium sp. MSJ-4]|uniref:dTDP-4-dehydrorhamnose reductase n=1 Tax=Clostridium simiarum TaxID=2841506 RepID=A0ABS6F2W5_9CLOT|nr:NAD(P)-dependent oxidoreductase [Clostridium simiarum]MBU5592813.1 NAD(P)-dependent oxidoreductase [Clostridium simiarum]
MKILISGGNGNIGSYLTKDLSSEHEIYSFTKADFDVCNKDIIHNIISKIEPDMVIHCAAITDIDYCEFNQCVAYSTNTIGSLNIASICSKFDIPLLYLSSNYVYGNYKSNPYIESDQCSPINIYGKTKLEGENLIRTLCNKFFILRTSWVIGGNNCPIKRILKNSSSIVLCSEEITNITYIKDLSEFIKLIIKTDNYGIYNLCNKGFTSKYDIVNSLIKNLEYNKKTIKIPGDYITSAAPRPSFSAINCDTLEKTFNINIPSWEDSIIDYLK